MLLQEKVNLKLLTEEEMKSGVASPYGVWGAFGTIDGGEVANEF